MEIILNGEAMILDHPCSISQLLEKLGLSGRLAIEVNQRIVPRSEFDHHFLNHGDRIEIVHAIGGG